MLKRKLLIIKERKKFGHLEIDTAVETKSKSAVLITLKIFKIITSNNGNEFSELYIMPPLFIILKRNKRKTKFLNKILLYYMTMSNLLL